VLVPFSPGESLTVYRLQGQGLSLDLQRSLVQPCAPLREAWLSFLTQQAMGQVTYVLYDPRDGEGFIQVQYRPHQAAADVAYLAPSLAVRPSAANAWARLLDGASIEVAARGVQRLFASLPEVGPEMEVFAQAGFAIYACDEIFRLPQVAGWALSGPPGLRPQRTEDWPALQKLCLAITPQRVRQIEGGVAAAPAWGKRQVGYVLPGEANGDDLAAAVYIYTGGQAHRLRLLLRPDAAGVAGALIDWALSQLAGQPPRPVYCSVRQYESGIREPLLAAGFDLDHSRALVVKQTTALVKAAVQELVPALKGSAEPVYHSSQQSAVTNHHSAAADP
jgi:hypothetical protein